MVEKTLTCLETFYLAKMTSAKLNLSPECFGLWTLDCGLRTADCGLRTADCGLQTRDKMQTEGKIHTADQG